MGEWGRMKASWPISHRIKELQMISSSTRNFYTQSQIYTKRTERSLILTTCNKPQSHSSPASTYPFPHSVGSNSWKRLGRQRKNILIYHRKPTHQSGHIHGPIISYYVIFFCDLLWWHLTDGICVGSTVHLLITLLKTYSKWGNISWRILWRWAPEMTSTIRITY